MAKTIAKLLGSFVPSDYDLSLKIDSHKMEFSGTVIVTGKKIGPPSKRLTFHQHDLNIKTIKVNYASKTGLVELKVERLVKHKSFDQLRIHFGQLIYPGQYKVEIEFAGRITTQMEGIYPAFYKEKDQQKTIIATQFETHFAREVFPCIDEPEAKAIFYLSLETKEFKSVVSNSAIKSQKMVKGKLVTVFEPTPKMSTYLLAFVIGDLKYLEMESSNGVKVRTYATPDNVEHTKFALECGVKFLDFYTNYYGIGFPLPKCDLIALPDFASGAMENWGCITFREQALLLDSDNTSLLIKQYVANVIAHELAHQWFGNLVTMRWWSDLWLNESFASWMSYLAVDNLFPDWQVWTQFIFDEQEKALQADALANTHPIEVAIHHPDEIRSIFDAISYEKGASVIAMLNNYLGAELFQRGVNLYLKNHAYGNSVTLDLWRAMEEASKKEVQQFMHKWISLGGYPLISLASTGTKTELTQTRFHLNPGAPKDKSIWPVPVNTESGGQEIKLFYSARAVLDPKLIKPSSLINKHRQGFYRVVYEEDELQKIYKKDFHNLDTIDRLALISDHIEAAKAGFCWTLLPLELLKYYDHEDQLAVWDILASFIGNIRLTMNDEDLREAMKPFIRKLVHNEVKRLGFSESKSDGHLDKLLRPLILGLAAAADDPVVIHWAEDKFHSGRIHPDFKAVIYTTIARRGGVEEFNKLLKLHNYTQSPEEKLNLAAALTNFREPELIKRALTLIKSDNVRKQDVFGWVTNSFYNHKARDLTWEWLVDNWQWLSDNFSNDISFTRLPAAIGGCYSDYKSLETYKKFFQKNTQPGLERPIKQGIETIQWRSAWRERDLKAIKGFFA